MAENWLDRYAITGLATLAGMHQFVIVTKAVGEARSKYNVKPPEITGPPEFERTFRAQQNTLEFFPVSMAGLWVASGFLHPLPASVAYMGYLYGRKKYFDGYVKDAEKRVEGFSLSVKFLKAIFFLCFLGVGHKTVRLFTNVDLWELITNNIPALSN